MSRKSAWRVCRTGNVICTGKPAAGKSFLLYDTLIAKGLVPPGDIAVRLHHSERTK